MGFPSPFEVSRQIGNNLAGTFREVKDENAIESILSNAMQSENPAVLQQSIGKILSQVSPERQGAAIQYLQNTYKQIQEKQAQARKAQAAKEAGISPDLPPQVQAAQFREGAKSKRLAEADKTFQNVSTPSTPARPDKSVLERMAGHPDLEVRERAKAELKSIQKEEEQNRADLRAAKKSKEDLERERRKETFPFRQTIANKAASAEDAIRSKNKLKDIIKTNKIDDPTYAVVMEALPLKLGKRFLSPETVEYKSNLIQEYGTLRNIFSGTTRVKEIELLEEKVPDVYLTDAQKEAIIDSSINAAKIDIIKAEIASELEKEDLSLLEFQRELDKRAKQKIDALASQIIDQQKAILEQAENKKKLSLDPNDPEDRQILEQILKEAGGDKAEARKIAIKKGYKL